MGRNGSTIFFPLCILVYVVELISDIKCNVELVVNGQNLVSIIIIYMKS